MATDFTLFSGNHHAVNPQGWRSKRAAEFKIVANFRDVVEHVLEIAGDSDLFHGIGELAIFDPQSAGAARKITGDHVDAESEELEDIETLLNASDNLLRRAFAFLQKEISRADAGRARQSPRGVAGRFKPQFFRGVGIEQIGFEHAVFNDHGPTRRDALAVKWLGAKTAGNRSIVYNCNVAGGDLLSQLAGQEGRLAINGVTIDRIKNVIQNCARNHGI